jgi:hypothetical protein
MFGSANRFPPSLLITYKDVQNVIIGRMNVLSRKHYQDRVSVELWLGYLRDIKQYKSYFNVHPCSAATNGPFLASWMSPWQIKVRFYHQYCLIPL